jgi:Asp-tRNA(Asn)/Glu-tRNA(Gln) amidotransferase A subunit family amidase
VSEVSGGPIGDLARAVAEGRCTALAAVEHALERITARDGEIGAVIALRAEQACAEAAKLDQEMADGEVAPGPLAGVPALVKDLEDVAGLPTRKGSLLLSSAAPAERDEVVPARLRAAGAIVVGKTNLPEFATEGFTDNLLEGVTRNPWAVEYSPGGSSGGSAAALSAGMVPVATATDGGGSVRIPAAFCGLVGIKPTHGLVGRWPVADWIDLSTYGPMATTVADLRLLLSLIAGVVPGDPSSAPAPIALDADPGPAPRRLIAAQRTSPMGPLPEPVAKLHAAGVEALAEVLGVPVTWLEPEDVFPGRRDPDLDWVTLATAEHVAALGREAAHAGLDRMHPATAAFMRHGLQVGLDDYLAARRRRPGYTQRLDGMLGRDRLLVTPTVAVECWLADGRLGPDDIPGMLPPEVYSTALQNVTGHPAITMPAGMTPIGIPFGLQVTGPRWRDGLLLDIAARWESEQEWPRTAPGYDEFAVPDAE